jgi:hypothetical protein
LKLQELVLTSEGLKVFYDWARRSVVVLATVIVLLPISVRSQTATSIAMKGSVSQTVVLSMSPIAMRENIKSETVTEGNNLRLSLSGNSDEPAVIRVPLLLRSNTGYRISTRVESQSVIVNQLSVTSVRGTGKFVSAEAINVTVAQRYDESTPLDLSNNSLILSGPRISLAGTLNAPDNALEIFLLIRVTPMKQAGSWQLNMTFSAAAGGVL